MHNFFWVAARVCFEKQVVRAYFFEFGESSEILQTHCFIFFEKILFFFKWHQAKISLWTWSEFGDSPNSPNSLQTHMFSFFCYLLFLDKRNEFGVSLEILQTDSKFGPNSYVFIFSVLFFFGKRGMSLEWVWGFSLGILQTHPKLKWFLFFSLCVSLYCYLKHFLGREEWVWSKFGGSSNSLQTYSKLAPNSYGFILLFLLYCQLIVFILSVIFTGSFLRKRNEFGGSPKSLQSRWGHL